MRMLALFGCGLRCCLDTGVWRYRDVTTEWFHTFLFADCRKKIKPMKILTENPFRILGVFANSPKRDVVANKGKMAAFLNVGRSVSFPLDLTGLFGEVNRTAQSVNDAESHLAIAKEQLKFAQFWFLKMTPLDDIAFNHLTAGNTDEAISIWNKQENLSSLQNKMVCYLAKNYIPLAISSAIKLYEKYGNEYISKVSSADTLGLTSTDLIHLFIDTIGEEIGFDKLMTTLIDEESNSFRQMEGSSYEEWKTYIKSQTVSPLIQKINSEVERAKNTDHKDSSERYEAGKSLMKRTREALSQLKRILPLSDLQYQMIADKLGIEILQCGIDYYNNSNDPRAAYNAMELQKYAASVVVGKQAKDRCDENVKILKKIIDNLPPNAVFQEDKAIKEELARYTRLPDKISYAIDLLKNTKTHIQSIKTKLGANNPYYLKISTLIVQNALHNVIEEVNKAQEPLAKLSELLSGMNPYLRSSLLSGQSLKIDQIRDNVKETLREAWNATIIMDGFDLESGFKLQYTQNRNTLKSLCSQLGVSTYGSSSSGLSSSGRRTENAPQNNGGGSGCVVTLFAIMGAAAMCIYCFISII